MGALLNQTSHGPLNPELKAEGTKEESFSWMHVLEGFLGGASGVGIALVIFFAQMRQDRKKERKIEQTEKEAALCRLCQSITSELEDHRRMLQGEEYQEKKIERVQSGINYRNIYLNTSIFDSIKSSGHLLILSQFESDKYQLLLNLTDLYTRIEKHNDTIAYRTKHRDQYNLHHPCASVDDWIISFKPYEIYLTDLEDEVLVLLQGVEVSIERLLKEYPARNLQ
jgi:hypothetical protein